MARIAKVVVSISFVILPAQAVEERARVLSAVKKTGGATENVHGCSLSHVGGISKSEERNKYLVRASVSASGHMRQREEGR